MKSNLEGMSPEHLDVFREIGNIGAGNAVTALASMLDREIDMSVPEAEVVAFNEIMNILDGPETPVAGVLVDMSDDLTGYILLILDLFDAYTLVSMALNEDREIPAELSASDFSELDLSALNEIANILVGSYLSAISTLTGLRIDQSVPHLAMDMLGAIISIAAVEYGQTGDSVLFMKTNFSDVGRAMSGHFFLIPDYESYKILMQSLGMEP